MRELFLACAKIAAALFILTWGYLFFKYGFTAIVDQWSDATFMTKVQFVLGVIVASVYVMLAFDLIHRGLCGLSCWYERSVKAVLAFAKRKLMELLALVQWFCALLHALISREVAWQQAKLYWWRHGFVPAPAHLQKRRLVRPTLKERQPTSVVELA